MLVAGVWKRFRLRPRSLADLASDLLASRRENGASSLRRAFWALQDVSFAVEPGTTLGLVGANGSGKSTVLKLVAGMMRPTRGTVSATGRLTLLSHLGGAFHGDLTGRENVFLGGAILGFRPRQLRFKLEEIFAFAELEPFVDVPVKFYSSGMLLRLGFAIAAHLDPEILLVDEALVVGDAAFRDRCLDRILAFKAAGVTMVLASHERYLVEQLCDRAVLLHRGKVAADGKPEEVFLACERLVETDHSYATESVVEGDLARAPLTIERVELVGHAPDRVPVLAGEASLAVRITARATRDVRGAAIGVQVARDWHVLHGTRSNRQGIEIDARVGDRVTLELEYPRLSLSRGTYILNVLVLEHRLAQTPVLRVKRAVRFRVTQGETDGVGLVRLPHRWRLGVDQPRAVLQMQ